MNVVCRLYNVDAAHQTPHCVNVQWIQIYLNHFLFGETIPDTFFLKDFFKFFIEVWGLLYHACSRFASLDLIISTLQKIEGKL